MNPSRLRQVESPGERSASLDPLRRRRSAAESEALLRQDSPVVAPDAPESRR